MRRQLKEPCVRLSQRIVESAEESEEGAELEAVVETLNEHVRKTVKSIHVAFMNFDSDGSGFLEMPEVAQLIHSLMPALTHRFRSAARLLRHRCVARDS